MNYEHRHGSFLQTHWQLWFGLTEESSHRSAGRRVRDDRPGHGQRTSHGCGHRPGTLERAQNESGEVTNYFWVSHGAKMVVMESKFPWAQTYYEMAGNAGQLAQRTPCPGPTSSRALVDSAYRQWVRLRSAWCCCHEGSGARAGTGQPTTLSICSPTDTPQGRLPHRPVPSKQEALCPKPSLVCGLCC